MMRNLTSDFNTIAGACWLLWQAQSCDSRGAAGCHPDLHKAAQIHWKVLHVVHSDSFKICSVLWYSLTLKTNYSNVPKTRSTLQKLIILHKEFHHDDDVLLCYSQLVGTIESGEGREEPVAVATPGDDQAAVGQIWIETTSYLLGRKELTPDTWTMVSIYMYGGVYSMSITD